jgi:hypothetical protein
MAAASCRPAASRGRHERVLNHHRPWPGTELSEGGMELYAGIWLKPGDLLEVEFGIPHRVRMTAVVRHRNGFCFGLEFIAPLQT